MSSENPVAPTPAQETNVVKKKPVHSAWLAWSVTIAEGILWVGAVVAFSWYWLMLPVKYRVYGLTGLTLSGAVGIFRIVYFYRKHRRSASKEPSEPAD